MMLKSERDAIAEQAPDECNGDGCDNSDFNYRPDFDVYACEGCYEKAIQKFMGVFE